jgi:hypothetical protein
MSMDRIEQWQTSSPWLTTINEVKITGFLWHSLGWDGRDSRVAMNLQKERGGVTIKVDPAEIKAALERDGK